MVMHETAVYTTVVVLWRVHSESNEKHMVPQQG